MNVGAWWSKERVVILGVALAAVEAAVEGYLHSGFSWSGVLLPALTVVVTALQRAGVFSAATVAQIIAAAKGATSPPAAAVPPNPPDPPAAP